MQNYVFSANNQMNGAKVACSYNGSVTISMKQNTINGMIGNEYRDFVKNLCVGIMYKEMYWSISVRQIPIDRIYGTTWI